MFFYDKCTAVKRDCMTLSYCGQLFSHSACSHAVSTGLGGCRWSGEEAFIVRFLPSWAQRQLAAKFETFCIFMSTKNLGTPAAMQWCQIEIWRARSLCIMDSVNYDIVFIAFLAYVLPVSWGCPHCWSVLHLCSNSSVAKQRLVPEAAMAGLWLGRGSQMLFARILSMGHLWHLKAKN